MVGGNNDKWPLFKGFSWKLKRRGSLEREELRIGAGGEREPNAIRPEGTTYTWSYSTADINSDELGAGVRTISTSSYGQQGSSANRCSEGLILRVPTRTAYNGPTAYNQHYQQSTNSESHFGNANESNNSAIGESRSGIGGGVTTDCHDASGDESDDEEYYYYDDDDDADNQDATIATESTSFIDFYNNQQRERQYREKQLQQRQWEYPNYIHNNCTTSEIRTTAASTAPTIINTNKFADKWQGNAEGGKR